VPATLAAATAQAALLWAIRGNAAAGLLSASVAALAEAGLASLAWTKLKLAGAMLLAVCVAGGGAGMVTHRLRTESSAALPNDTSGAKSGRKTLADRLEGLPPPNETKAPRPGK
jgi:hypothetical protein